jgi:Type IV secretion system pilin
MRGLFAAPLQLLADSSSAANVMHSFVSPIISTMCAVGALACVFFLVNGGIAYITSSGKPENLEYGKRVIRNALIGLVIIFAASALTQILTHAYGGSAAVSHASVPNLTAIKPAPVHNGLVSVIIKAITGVLNDIIRSLAAPFINSLAFFTKSTPLMADNSTVFNMWLAVVGICDALFVLVIALLGFHVMSATTFGFDEIDIKHLLPRLALIFLALNTSIFIIDGVIEISNAMIHALNLANGTKALWSALNDVAQQSAELGLPSLLIMMLFTIFAVVLVIYYLGRLITLYIGAILSPLILLLWLLPGFRDFSETAAKTYVMTIFVLFVQVGVLIVSGSLIAGLVVGSPTQTTGTLMPMVTGVAAMYAVLKVPGVMNRLSFASMGPRSARQLGGQFINGISYMTKSNQKTIASIKKLTSGGEGSSDGNAGNAHLAEATYKQPRLKNNDSARLESSKGNAKPKIGETVVAEHRVQPKKSKSKSLKEKA